MESRLSQESFSPRRTDESQGDPWENVPTPVAAESDDELFGPVVEEKEDKSLFAKLRRIGSSQALRDRSSMLHVIYKLEIPLGKEETFLAAFWKHEPVLRKYATEVSICKSADVQPRVRKGLNFVGSGDSSVNLSSSTSVASTVNNSTSNSPLSSSDGVSVPLPSNACKVCKSEGKADPCTEYIAGPLRRVKESGDEGASFAPSSEVHPMGGATQVAVGVETTALSSSPFAITATSPIGKRTLRSNSGVSWSTQISRFVERRCRTCGHLALDHTSEGKTAVYVLHLEFKTRAAWESSFQSSEEVTSESMKNCIARLYEPSVLEQLDEHEPAMQDDSLQLGTHSSLDEDLSAATESMDEKSEKQPRPAFRLSLWKAQNLPRRSDGKPHTWIVQAKFGKSVLTSSAKTSNDPVWKQHFHFRYKEGRKLHLRIAATDEPREAQGKLKINVKDRYV
jgi:hypothetical protein